MPSKTIYIYIYIYSFSLFNSSRRLMLYIVYFTVPRHLFHWQKTSWLIWMKKWPRNSRMHQTFSGPLLCYCDYHYPTASPSLNLTPSSDASAMTLCCFCRPPQVSCCLLFVRGHLLYSLLKRLFIKPIYLFFSIPVSLQDNITGPCKYKAWLNESIGLARHCHSYYPEGVLKCIFNSIHFNIIYNIKI